MFGGGFGSTTNTFGSGGFGGGGTTGGSVFGQPTQPQQTTGLFGSGGTGAFGTQQSSLPVFGSGAATSQIGAFGTPTGSPSVFGQQIRPSTGIFSSTASAISPFSTQTQSTGTSIPFNAITGTDTMMKNGAASQINTRHQCITCMKEYENKSLEELRLEDYQLNRKGPQNPMFNPAQTQTQPGSSLFSGIGGGAVTGTSTFGQTPAFGQSTVATGGSLFGSLNQQKPGGFFGSPATPSTSTAFGGGSALGGFAFNNPTSQPQTSLFSSNNNPATSNTGLGATSAFSFASQPQQQQQQGLGLFGQKPLTTPASSASPFGAFAATATNTGLNKPLFGQATPTPSFGVGSAAPTFGTGTGSLFSTNTQQQQQQPKPFSFNTPFSSAQQPTSQPSFGTTSTTSFSFSNPVSTPAISFGGGTAPTFGNTAGTGTSTFGSGLSFSLGSNTQPTGTTGSSGFGSGLFSNTSNTGTGVTGSGGGLSLFGPGSGGTSSFGSSGFGTGSFSLVQPQSLQLQQQQQQQNQMQNQSLISFATIPFKDSDLFYNLISNRKVEDMAKPTNPIAQRHYREASRRKTSTSISNSSNLPTGLNAGPPLHSGGSSNVNIGLPHSIKSLAITLNSKNSSISKFHVFEGFEDDDLGISVDVLTPKSNAKKLVMKNGAEVNNSASQLSVSFTSLYGDSSRNNQSGGLVRMASALQGSTPLGNNSKRESLEIMMMRRKDSENMGRKLEFEESNLSNDTYGSVLNNSDAGADIVEHFGTNGIHPSSSKRASEVDIPGVGGILNGGLQPVLNEAEPDLQQSGQICGVICSRPGYYCKPGLPELDKRMDGNSNCIVPGFEVGRKNYGRIKFLDPVNVTNVNLDEIILFRHKEVIVYPDDDNKPELGKGLNVPAEIELERVFPIDKTTNTLLRNPERIRAQGYEQKLRKACDKLGAEFILYDDIEGIWKFKVSHFSKYGIEEDEDEDNLRATGLGGISQKNLKAHQRVVPPLMGPGGDAALNAAVAYGRPFPPDRDLAAQFIPSPDSSIVLATKTSSPLADHITPPVYVPSSPIFSNPSLPVSDVELNPLTPLDSDDDDDDLDDEDDDMDDRVIIHRPSTISVPVTQVTSPTQTSKFKSILKEAIGNEKSLMMKNVMSFEDLDEEDPASHPIIDRQPPAKKSRSSTRVSLIPPLGEESGMEQGQKLKERLSLAKPVEKDKDQQVGSLVRPPPPAIIPIDEIEFSDPETMENLFEELECDDIANNIRVRGCPRVCFARNGQHIIVEQSMTPFGFHSEVVFNQFPTYAEKLSVDISATTYRNVLEDQMTARLQKREGVLFSNFKNIVSKKLNSKGISSINEALKDEIIVWDLCSLLWPTVFDFSSETYKDDGYPVMKRKRFCQWISKYAKDLFPEEWERSGSSLFAYMRKGLLEDGALKAVNDGLNWTAVLMCTEPHLYLNLSGDKEVLEHMEIEKGNEELEEFIALLSGNFSETKSFNKELAKSMNTESYLQYFAMYMWYEGKVESELPVSIEESLKRFDGMLRELNWISNCDQQMIECPSVATLCVHLLKFYSITGYPLDIFMSPSKFSEDVLDYKMIWLLMTNLEVIGHVPTDETYKRVCLQYAGMLESIGLWKWAYFAMEFVPRPDVVAEEGRLATVEEETRRVFCRRLMERNLSRNSAEDEASFEDWMEVIGSGLHQSLGRVSISHHHQDEKELEI